MKIIVAQKGAREHYAVAQALHQRGLLAALVTDWYAYGKSGNGGERNQPSAFLQAFIRSPWWGIRCLIVRCLSFVIPSPSAQAARCEGIPDELVHAFPFRSLLWKWKIRRLKAQGRLYEAFAETDAAFASAVARCHLPAHEVFFGYSYASLETLAAEKKRGVLMVLDQIDPGAGEFRLVAEEMARFPELAGPPLEFPNANFERNRLEWELADIIIVNSEWSREAIVAEGADPDKIEILPLAYEHVAVGTARDPGGVAAARETADRKAHRAETRGSKRVNSANDSPQGDMSGSEHPRDSDLYKMDSSLCSWGSNWSAAQQGSKIRKAALPPQSSIPSSFPASSSSQVSGFSVSAFPLLRVLWLGQVNVRKGIHYLVEAARLLERENIRFDVVGPVGILPKAVAAAPMNMTFHGAVSRDRASEWYQQADVFVLPTLSDGFALTQLESLAHGLPVIATPNCGRVVEDGKTGFIIPPRDPQALADAVLKFVAERTLTSTMAPACREAVKAYSIEAYGKHLVEIINSHSAGRSMNSGL